MLFNIFGGITRCDEVAKGLIAAFEEIKPAVPFVVRLDGTNDVQGRALLEQAKLPNIHAAKTMNEAAEKVVELARQRKERVPDGHHRRRRDATGRRRHHRARGLLPRAATTVATAPTSSPASRPARAARTSRASPSSTAGPTPCDEAGANTAMIFVPPRFAADSILEAAAAGVQLIIAITEGIPAHDELRVYNTLKRDHPGTRLIGPNCPGILSPGKANVGHHPRLLLQARQRRRRLPVGHAHLPDRQRDRPGRLRQQLDRRHRRRPGPRLLLYGHPGALPGRPRDRADRDVRRDRRLRRGAGGRLHRRVGD